MNNQYLLRFPKKYDKNLSKKKNSFSSISNNLYDSFIYTLQHKITIDFEYEKSFFKNNPQKSHKIIIAESASQHPYKPSHNANSFFAAS